MSEPGNGKAALGAATGGIRTLLRLEGAALFLASLAGYALTGETWWLFALLILAPDLAFAAYLAGSRVGAMAYNATHATIAPLALLVIGLFLPSSLVSAVALVWLAHIGADRAIGYGLKYASGFADTHLGRIGKQAAR